MKKKRQEKRNKFKEAEDKKELIQRKEGRKWKHEKTKIKLKKETKKPRTRKKQEKKNMKTKRKRARTSYFISHTAANPIGAQSESVPHQYSGIMRQGGVTGISRGTRFAAFERSDPCEACHPPTKCRNTLRRQITSAPHRSPSRAASGRETRSTPLIQDI